MPPTQPSPTSPRDARALYLSLLRFVRPIASRMKCDPEELVGVAYETLHTSIARWSPDRGCTLHTWLNTGSNRKRMWAAARNLLYPSPTPALPLRHQEPPEVHEADPRLRRIETYLGFEVTRALAGGLSKKHVAHALGVLPSTFNERLRRMRNI